VLKVLQNKTFQEKKTLYFLGTSLALFFVGLFTLHATLLIVLGLYVVFPLCCSYVYSKKIPLTQLNFKQSLLFQLTSFALITFLTIFLTLSVYLFFIGTKTPLVTFSTNMLKVLLFLVFCLVALHFKTDFIKLIIASFLLIICIATIKGFIILFFYTGSAARPLTIEIREGIIQSFVIALPFLYGLLFTVKSKPLKFGLLTLCLLSYFLLIYSGARGAWLSVIVSLFFCAGFCVWRLKEKPLVSWLILCSLSFVCVVYAISTKVPDIKAKINSFLYSQSINGFTSGRLAIVKERLPLVLSHGSFSGMGFGKWSNEQYLSFMEKYHAPTHIGRWITDEKLNKQIFLYYNDEPFILSIYYQGGILAAISFISMLALTFLLIFNQIKKISPAKTPWLFTNLIGIFGSLLAYTISGLFEFREYDIYLTLVILALFLSYDDKKQHNTLKPKSQKN
jgi:O-antigen ligase